MTARDHGVDPIKQSRRKNLSLVNRAIIHWLPRAVYRQILREYEIGARTLGKPSP